MRIRRIGFSPLKGGRHLDHAVARLDCGGADGDRRFCLLDLDSTPGQPASGAPRGRVPVLRTVAHPSLLRVAVTAADGMLSVELSGRRVVAPVPPGGELVSADYWGRPVEVEVLEGPWASFLGEHLGRGVALARARVPGDVVYGGSVSLVTTSSLHELGERLTEPVDPARFRATLEVDVCDAPPHVEDDWVGRRLAVGEVELVVTARIPRCGVVDLDPVSGARDVRVLGTLAGYRRFAGETWFGVDAEAVRPGRVRTGDRVVLGRS